MYVGPENSLALDKIHLDPPQGFRIAGAGDGLLIVERGDGPAPLYDTGVGGSGNPLSFWIILFFFIEYYNDNLFVIS